MFKLLLALFFTKLSFADYKFSFDSIVTLQRNEVIDSAINPSNLVLNLPDEEYNLDLRGELKYRRAHSQVVIRPRLVSHQQKISDISTDQDQTEFKTEFNLTDAFIETNWNSFYTTTFGLQVYQWGPTEFLNVSNPIFHFNSKQKSLIYKEKGQFLIRNNFSIDKENNIVISLVPISNNESEWIEGEEFVPKAYIKYEKSWSGTSDLLGFVIGSEEKKNLFLGQYFNISFLESASFYADIKEGLDKINAEPVSSGAGYDLAYLKSQESTVTLLADIGLRWEADFDFRIEYIFNSAGFDQNETRQAIASASNLLNPRYQSNIRNFIKPGLEIIGKNYIYSSIRFTDPLGIQDFNLYSRILYSLQDYSEQIQFEFDKAFLENFNLFANQTLSYGNEDTEFRLTNAWSFLLGLKYSL